MLTNKEKQITLREKLLAEETPEYAHFIKTKNLEYG